MQGLLTAGMLKVVGFSGSVLPILLVGRLKQRVRERERERERENQNSTLGHTDSLSLGDLARGFEAGRRGQWKKKIPWDQQRL